MWRLFRQQGTQRTFPAAWLFLTAPILPRIHNQGMKFIEELRIAWKGRFDQRPNILILWLTVCDSVPAESPGRVGIDHKDCVFSSIQENGICCLRTDSVHGKKFLPQDFSRRTEHPFQ